MYFLGPSLSIVGGTHASLPCLRSAKVSSLFFPLHNEGSVLSPFANWILVPAQGVLLRACYGCDASRIPAVEYRNVRTQRITWL